MQLRIVSQLSDPVMPAVIELYQSAFPVREQMFASFFWRLFEPDGPRRLVVAEEEASLGFAVWESEPSGDPAYLWYIAVSTDARGQGIGTKLYQHVVDAVQMDGAPALMFEVELPEEVRGHAGRDAERIARKRIDWYKHMGAYALKGVSFDCGTDWNEPVLMLPMIHPFSTAITAEQAYQWGIDTLADGDPENFRQTGVLSLG